MSEAVDVDVGDGVRRGRTRVHVPGPGVLTTVTDPVPLMRARARDLPLLALLAGAAFGTRPFGRVMRWPLAVAGWPVWVGVLYVSMPYLWCVPQRGVVILRPPGTSTRARPRQFVILVSVAVVALAFLVVLSVIVVPLRGRGGWVLVGLAVTFLLVFIGVYPGRLIAGRSTLARDEPRVTVDLAASPRRGSGLLRAMCTHAEEEWPGAVVELAARDVDLVALYGQHWHLRQVREGRGRMVGRIDLDAHPKGR